MFLQFRFLLAFSCTTVYICVPSNFMANRRVPKFSLNNCAQSFKKTFMCPKVCFNPVLKYTKCHVSTNSSNFLKLCYYTAKTYLLLLQQIADSLKKSAKKSEKKNLPKKSGSAGIHVQQTNINIDDHVAWPPSNKKFAIQFNCVTREKFSVFVVKVLTLGPHLIIL